MTKKQLIRIVAQKSNLTYRAAKDAVDTFLDEIVKSLSQGEKVKISGFGVFTTKLYKARSVIPFGKTAETKKVASRRLPKFLGGSRFKRKVR